MKKNIKNLTETDIIEDIDKFLHEAGYGSADQPDFAPPGEAPKPSTSYGQSDQPDFQSPGPAPKDAGPQWKHRKEGDTKDNLIYTEQIEKWEIQIDTAMHERIKSVMVLGESGVGKTTMIEEAANHYGIKFGYFNAPTMDPHVHLVGIPDVSADPVNPNKKILDFVRQENLQDKELLFIDEINRVKMATQNALFELVASQKINGQRIGRIAMVWGAMNPPHSDESGTAGVMALDKAFRGRFKEVFDVGAMPKMRHYIGRGADNLHDGLGNKGISEDVARTCLRWWNEFIKGQTEEGAEGTVRLDDVITPRVLEYLMEKIQRLENYANNPKLEKSRYGKKVNWQEYWNAQFEAVTQYHRLGEETTGVKMPYDALKAAFLGEEIFALSALRNSAPDIEETCKALLADHTQALASIKVLTDAIRGTVERPVRVPYTDIGDFSRVVCIVPKNFAEELICGRQEISSYLYYKRWYSDAEKQLIKRSDTDPVLQPMSSNEYDIYERFAESIDGVTKINIAKRKDKIQGSGGNHTPEIQGRIDNKGSGDQGTTDAAGQKTVVGNKSKTDDTTSVRGGAGPKVGVKTKNYIAPGGNP